MGDLTSFLAVVVCVRSPFFRVKWLILPGQPVTPRKRYSILLHGAVPGKSTKRWKWCCQNASFPVNRFPGPVGHPRGAPTGGVGPGQAGGWPAGVGCTRQHQPVGAAGHLVPPAAAFAGADCPRICGRGVWPYLTIGVLLVLGFDALLTRFADALRTPGAYAAQ